ncbi:hypothetical protein AJ80_01086 [Polytolypa hystricis UAMH7299]|uniref:Uncharacterized protein n=1 Tax=Polytolypa hystricis (strain UAMH7299) TaxID=1447883 RepID=A0A2B7Z135_POLH7|nr:hypothetical protein AJ80_01086 [Polytolypa hystricis UAMH7299]
MPKKLTAEERDQRADEAGFDPDKFKLDGERVLRELEPSTCRDYNGFIYQKLHKHVPLSLEQHQRDYVMIKHFKNLIQQLWQNDWYEFPYPLYRVYLSVLLKMCMYSSARVGEYVESTGRAGSGRGLYVPEGLTFLVIHNGKGQSEIIVRPKRDAKNMSKRKTSSDPRHPMQEDIETLPLYLNPVLEPLAIYLARGLFRDFKTVDEILALEPPPGEEYEIALGHLDEPKDILKQPVAWFPAVADINGKGTPFFEKISDEGPTGEILTASWLDKELGKLGRRAGYDKLISIHDMCAETLVRTNENGYGIEELMWFAGHGGNPRIFFESYMSSTSSVQGVPNILKDS